MLAQGHQVEGKATRKILSRNQLAYDWRLGHMLGAEKGMEDRQRNRRDQEWAWTLEPRAST